jgi:hypothetical protein
MPSFKERLVVRGHGKFDFEFTCLYTRTQTRYFIVVADGDSKVYQFFMTYLEGYWLIAEAHNLPDWITGMERELEKSIRHH